jgi:magnesium-transporting ATPase (P-type)
MTSLSTTSPYDYSASFPTNYAIDIGQSSTEIQQADEQNQREPVTMRSWSVILILVAVGIFILFMCFYRIYSEFKSPTTTSLSSNNDTTSSATSQNSSLTSTGKHSPRSRKRLVMEYLRDHTDNEMVGHYDISPR